ncbi:hypothetical protein IG631_14228 [Alternaria alternata]|nr:hypothetical protein IG631_14228 [Alternaria alternata]
MRRALELLSALLRCRDASWEFHHNEDPLTNAPISGYCPNWAAMPPYRTSSCDNLCWAKVDSRYTPTSYPTSETLRSVHYSTATQISLRATASDGCNVISICQP